MKDVYHLWTMGSIKNGWNVKRWLSCINNGSIKDGWSIKYGYHVWTMGSIKDGYHLWTMGSIKDRWISCMNNGKYQRWMKYQKMAIIYEQWEVSKMDEVSKDGYHVWTMGSIKDGYHVWTMGSIKDGYHLWTMGSIKDGWISCMNNGKYQRWMKCQKMAIMYEQWEVSKMDEVSKDGYHLWTIGSIKDGWSVKDGYHLWVMGEVSKIYWHWIKLDMCIKKQSRITWLAKTIKYVTGHPKMSTFSWMYKQYSFSDPFPPPLQMYRTTFLVSNIWVSHITFIVQKQKLTLKPVWYVTSDRFG